ncbi:MAG: nucleoid occlusion factor SlmA [Gammaproteobacteria bacterium]
MTTKPSRKQQILESLAYMLETNQGERITTANLAAEVGVSEAALYRHFPSKAKMFEALIEFVEETVFTRINRITGSTSIEEDRLGQILTLMLSFADKNPGICRILTGEALTGEQERLRKRIIQFYNRLETQLKQSTREWAAANGQDLNANLTAELLLNIIDGRVQVYVRSEFSRSPMDNWQQQWKKIHQGLLIGAGLK